jgi:hypothetical protein
MNQSIYKCIELIRFIAPWRPPVCKHTPKMGNFSTTCATVSFVRNNLCREINESVIQSAG